MDNCFREELARDWKLFRYLAEPRLVALEPPPLDLWISVCLVEDTQPEILRLDGDRDIYITVENCHAHYRVDYRDHFGPGSRYACHLVSATYTHHQLPPRETPR